MSNLDLGQRKRKFWLVLHTGCVCLFEWEILLFLKNCMLCFFLLCYGLRQQFLTLFEELNDLKWSLEEAAGENLWTAYRKVSMSSWHSTSVMQMFHIIFTFHEHVLDEQCKVLDREIILTSLWPSHQTIKMHTGISVIIKNALLMFLYTR